MRAVALLALAGIDRALDYIEAVEARVELRRFLRDNPAVTIHWTDGTE